jgi:hypothetical protein
MEQKRRINAKVGGFKHSINVSGLHGEEMLIYGLCYIFCHGNEQILINPNTKKPFDINEFAQSIDMSRASLNLYLESLIKKHMLSVKRLNGHDVIYLL